MRRVLDIIRQYRRLFWITVAVIAIALLGLSCANSQKKVRLQMKFQDGRELVYEQVNKQTISVRNSPTVSQQSQSKGEMTQVIKSLLPTGGARVEETSTWSWSEQAPDSTIQVVSSSESLSYDMNTDGKISGLELLSDKDASKWKEYASQNLEQSQPTFPAEEVGKGYTWMQTVKIFMPSGEALDASTTYEVKDFVETDGHKCAIIDYKGNLILPFDVMESDSLSRRGVDKVDVAGTLVFDYENGYTFSQEETTRVTAERSKILGNEATSSTFFIEGELFFHLKSAK
jgi:hypothetical protein